MTVWISSQQTLTVTVIHMLMRKLRPVTDRRLCGRRSRAGRRRHPLAVRPQSQGRSGREDCHPQRSQERVLDGDQLAPRLIRHELAIQLRIVVACGDQPDATLARPPQPNGESSQWREGLLGPRRVPRSVPARCTSAASREHRFFSATGRARCTTGPPHGRCARCSGGSLTGCRYVRRIAGVAR